MKRNADTELFAKPSNMEVLRSSMGPKGLYFVIIDDDGEEKHVGITGSENTIKTFKGSGITEKAEKKLLEAVRRMEQEIE